MYLLAVLDYDFDVLSLVQRDLLSACVHMFVYVTLHDVISAGLYMCLSGCVSVCLDVWMHMAISALLHKDMIVLLCCCFIVFCWSVASGNARPDEIDMMWVSF